MAAYCSLKLPDFIKQNENYKTKNYKKALEDSFVSIDASIVERDVVDELKKIAGTDIDEQVGIS